MPDLNSLEAAQTVKIAGSDSSGLESTFVDATANNELKVSDTLHSSAVYGAISVGASIPIELKVGALSLSNRKSLVFQSNRRIYVGFDSSVSTTTGIKYEKDQVVEYPITDSITLFAITDSGTANVRVQELS